MKNFILFFLISMLTFTNAKAEAVKLQCGGDYYDYTEKKERYEPVLTQKDFVHIELNAATAEIESKTMFDGTYKLWNENKTEKVYRLTSSTNPKYNLELILNRTNGKLTLFAFSDKFDTPKPNVKYGIFGECKKYNPIF